MSFEYIQRIPQPADIIQQMPLPEALISQKKTRDLEILDVFTGKSSKFILIIGPCSADNEDAVCDYVNRLAAVQDKVKDVLLLIPRIYTNKPRTTGEGYKGMAHQPNPHEEPDVVEGIKAIRRLHLRVLAETGLTAADEMLYPQNYPFLEDLLSYVAIGARSVENQQHRLTVSGLDIPVGMKNPTSGDVTVMLNSIKAAQIPHEFIYNDWAVKTTGNPYAHCILRGAFNQYGQSIPNYHFEDLIALAKVYLKPVYANHSIIVDTSHANSNKDYTQQPRVAREVLFSRKNSQELHGLVKGLMIESYIEGGRQDISEKTYGKSITDPCLGWEDSQELILEIADTISGL